MSTIAAPAVSVQLTIPFDAPAAIPAGARDPALPPACAVRQDDGMRMVDLRRAHRDERGRMLPAYARLHPDFIPILAARRQRRGPLPPADAATDRDLF